MDSGRTLLVCSIGLLALFCGRAASECVDGELSCPRCSMTNSDDYCQSCPLETGNTLLSCNVCFGDDSEPIPVDCNPGCYFCPECDTNNLRNITHGNDVIETCNCDPMKFNTPGNPGLLIPLGSEHVSPVTGPSGNICDRTVTCMNESPIGSSSKKYVTRVQLICPTAPPTAAPPTAAPATPPPPPATAPPATPPPATAPPATPPPATAPPVTSRPVSPRLTPARPVPTPRGGSGGLDKPYCGPITHRYYAVSGCKGFRQSASAGMFSQIDCPDGTLFDTKSCVCNHQHAVSCSVA